MPENAAGKTYIHDAVTSTTESVVLVDSGIVLLLPRQPFTLALSQSARIVK